jgi:hypothetical protein
MMHLDELIVLTSFCALHPDFSPLLDHALDGGTSFQSPYDSSTMGWEYCFMPIIGIIILTNLVYLGGFIP